MRNAVCLRQEPESVASYFNRHVDVVGEEEAGSQALRHGDMRAVDEGCQVRDGVQADVALQRAGDP